MTLRREGEATGTTVKLGKIMFSLSSVILFRGFLRFFNLYDKRGLTTRLNGVKSICFEQSRKF